MASRRLKHSRWNIFRLPITISIYNSISMWEWWWGLRRKCRGCAASASPDCNAFLICFLFSTELPQLAETALQKRFDRWKTQQSGLECAIKTSTGCVIPSNIRTFGFSHRNGATWKVSGYRLVVSGFFQVAPLTHHNQWLARWSCHSRWPRRSLCSILMAPLDREPSSRRSDFGGIAWGWSGWHRPAWGWTLSTRLDFPSPFLARRATRLKTGGKITWARKSSGKSSESSHFVHLESVYRSNIRALSGFKLERCRAGEQNRDDE